MTDKIKRIFYGRRKGRALRPGRARLLESLLPRLRIELAGGKIDPAALFDPPAAEIWLEIGFGGGEHLAAQALAHPATGMIRCEPFVNGVARLLAEIERDGIANIRIYPNDARDLIDALPDASVGRVFVLFADPWPKTRHHRRRFIGRDNLSHLARIMKDGAELRLASDQNSLVRWMLFHATREPAFEWTARRAADWRCRAADWPRTRYEAKALAQGEQCVYLVFRRRPRKLAASSR